MAVLLTNIWLGIPFMMIVILGGLQSIAGDYYEAAEIDGASRWQQFRSVTLPMLRPVLGPAVTLGAIWTFNNFNVIYLVTDGGGEPVQSLPGVRAGQCLADWNREVGGLVDAAQE